MDRIAEILSSIFSLVMVVVPLYIIMLVRRRGVKGRKEAPRSSPTPPGKRRRTREPALPSEEYPTPLSFTPRPKVPEPGPPPQAATRRFGQPPPAEKPVPVPLPQRVREHPLLRIESYPVGKRAVILSEIIGRPKALRRDE